MRYWNVTGEGHHFNYSTSYTTKKYQHFNIKDCAGIGISVEGCSLKIGRYVSNQILIWTEYSNLRTLHTLCSLHTKYFIFGFHSLMSDRDLSMNTADSKGTQLNIQVDILAYVNHRLCNLYYLWIGNLKYRISCYYRAGSQILIWGEWNEYCKDAILSQLTCMCTSLQ
jgi:hypothetical protein